MKGRCLLTVRDAVSLISTQDIERYRQCLLGIDAPEDRKDELINIVHSIMSFFIDQAFGVQTDQITLESKNKSRFQAAFDRARIPTNPDNQPIDLKQEGARNDSSLQRPPAP